MYFTKIHNKIIFMQVPQIVTKLRDMTIFVKNELIWESSQESNVLLVDIVEI